MIPLSEPCIQGNEWKYIKECLDTEWVSTAGDYVTRFEEAVASYTGARFAVATVNGTSALQASLRLAGVESGDEVIVPTLTFIAPINAVLYNSAIPVFMDADRYYNIDSKKTISFIENETIFKDGFTYNKITGNKISAIIPVHVWGNACWLDDLVEICHTGNIAIVEDASESLGTFYTEGKYKGRHSGTIGKLGCLSFNGNKIITTGGGGMILTDDEDTAEKARYLTTQAKDDPVRYLHDDIGYNFRLTNIQAALGVAQMEQLPGFLNKKEGIYNKYLDGLRNIDGLDLASVPDYAGNNHWLNVLRIDSRVYGENSETLMNRLGKKGIQARLVWALNHLQKPYKHCQSYRVENAYKLYEGSLCIPGSVNLNEDLQRNIIDALKMQL